METKSLIQKFWLLMQQWREKSSKLYQSQKVQREYRSPTKSLVLIKNSFHLVEIAPRCEKTNNRGMVMEALQSLHRSPIQKIVIEGQIAFRVLSLLDLDHLATCLHLFQIWSNRYIFLPLQI